MKHNFLQFAKYILVCSLLLMSASCSDQDKIQKNLQKLTDGSSKVREDAIIALNEIDPNWRNRPEVSLATDKYITQLKDNNNPDRWMAALALGAIKDTRAIEPLIITFQQATIMSIREKHDDLLKSSTADALGNFQDTRALEPLIKSLEQDDVTIFLSKTAILSALSAIGKTHPQDLTQAMNNVEDKGVAYYFVNSKDSVLDKAGRTWAANHGYSVVELR